MTVVFGTVMGLALGLLGGGGATLTVPIFVYLLHAEPKAAIAMSLVVVGVTSAIGALSHWRAGRVDVRVGAVFGGVALVAAYAGARLSIVVPGVVQLTLLAVTMAGAALMMLRGRSAAEPVEGSAPLGVRALVGSAVAVGGLTGLAGAGGGFLVVPALVGLGVPMRDAVGSSLAIIAVNALAGFAGVVGRVAVDWPAVALVAAGAVPGIAAGVALHPRVPQARLRHAFAALLLAVAGFMLVERAGAALRAWFAPAA